VPIRVCETRALDGHGTAAMDCSMRCEQGFAPEGTKRRRLLEKLWGIVDHHPLRGHHHPFDVSFLIHHRIRLLLFSLSDA
jgi:hypothetical protein